MYDCFSTRDYCIASHHFPVIAKLCLEVVKTKPNKSTRLDFKSLRDTNLAREFANAVEQDFPHSLCQQNSSNVTDVYASIISCMDTVSQVILPSVAFRPWISAATLELIQERHEARAQASTQRERLLHKKVKASAKRNREQWLNDLASTGSWRDVRLLRRHKQQVANQGRLKDSAGVFVDTEQRAETLAVYLERVQWAVRPCSVSENLPDLGPTLEVVTSEITHNELEKAVRKLGLNRAMGPDRIPAELWKAILSSSEIKTRMVSFCNACLEQKTIPDQWHESVVALLFKKGDVAECENYRPISLQCVIYKAFASILLERLKDAGAEQRVWSTQFGFKSGCGTREALFVTRQIIENIFESKGGHGIFLALDWAKAFDSISVEGLLSSLRRFGLPAPFVAMVRGIYTNRCFTVRDSGYTSSTHPQQFGILQGCPLSPFLFSILMTVLVHDAKRELAQKRPDHTSMWKLDEILYADDTLLVGSDVETLQIYMDCICRRGHTYGLSFNASKLESLFMNCDGELFNERGDSIPHKDNLKYLGALLCADGRSASEISRRIGAAKSEFELLKQCWQHAPLSTARKMKLYSSLVLSKLLYGLESMVLSSSDARRINGFHAACCRKVSRISPAYVSRVSNKFVLDELGARPLTTLILSRLLKNLGALARREDDDPARSLIFQPGTLDLVEPGRRRQGRPRKSWKHDVFRHAVAAAGTQPLNNVVRNCVLRKQAVDSYCAQI